MSGMSDRLKRAVATANIAGDHRQARKGGELSLIAANDTLTLLAANGVAVAEFE